ncbi:MAG: acetyl-CoA C-acyltransferase [Xanthomonadaceae bacterium]|nr:acetyl-CoA C-acyltransferase [Xanthomonadaceae bacterium]
MSNSDRIVVVEGTRTPFVRARSVFANMAASTLGGGTLKETVARSGIDPKLIDEILFGIVSPPAEGSNIAREALFDSGLPSEITCTTINRYCASAAEAIAVGVAKISSGQIDIALAGGVESISSVRALFSLEATNFFQDFGKAKNFGMMAGHLAKFKMKYMTPMAPGIKEPTTGLTMGQSADLMARHFGVGRDEQDRYALDSHKKAHAAWERGFYKSHVIPVATPDSKVIDRDTDIRADSTLEKMGKLKPIFYKDGTITAANASPLTDGASSVLLMKESRSRELGLKPLAVIRSHAAAAINIKKEPLLIGPVYAIPKALKMAGISWNDVDLVEMHEAFAAQVLSSIKAIESDTFAKEKLGLSSAIGKVDPNKFNLNGGSIPLGHPFGATGGRVMIQLIHALREKKKNIGLISICAAGGLGTVTIVEAL